MRKSAILNLNRAKFFETIAKNKFVIGTLFCYVLGIVLGVVCTTKSTKVLEIARSDFSSYLTGRNGMPFFNGVLGNFFELLPMCLVIFICGTSVVGVVLIPIAVCYCGFEYGIVTAFLYRQYLLQGIAFNSLILIPSTLLAILGYILLSKEAFGFSIQLLKASMPGFTNQDFYLGLKGYSKHFFIIIFVFLLSALADSLLSLAFLGFFNF